MLFIFKTVTYFLGGASLFLLVDVATTGQAIKPGAFYKHDLKAHHVRVLWLLGTIVITLIWVELFKLFIPQLRGHPPIFQVHFPIAIAFLILFLSLLWLNGRSYPKTHRILVYPCLFLGTIVSGLGMWMNHLLPWH